MDTLKPCPFCGSSNVEDDYTAVITTFDGSRENPTGWHEYQDGWVDCLDCGARSGRVTVDVIAR